MREKSKKLLPKWGPYSKKYMGISRVMEESRIPGARYDLVIHPTYANSAFPVPNVTFPAGFHPWNADPDGKYFQYRCELIWKDSLYANVDLFEMDAENWGIRVEYVNCTDKMQNCLLNLFSAIEYPENNFVEVLAPDKCDRWNGLDYEQLRFQRPRPWERLSPDGHRRGEVEASEFTEGNGLGETYYCLMASHLNLKFLGGDPGDTIVYRRSLKNSYRDAVLGIRYRTFYGKGDVAFRTNHGTVTFAKTKTPRMVWLPLGAQEPGDFSLELCACGCPEDGVMIDFLCITEREEQETVQVVTRSRSVLPETETHGGKTVYRYPNEEQPLELTVFHDRIRERKVESGCLEDALANRLSNSDPTYDRLTMSFSGSFREKHSQDGYYHVKTAEAVFVPPRSSRAVYAYVGADQTVYRQEDLERRWSEAAGTIRTPEKSEGAGHSLSVQLLKAALFTNVVYPIQRHGQPMIHYTPGKRWDSLYTWDSGFIGLGILEYSRSRAEYVMDFYLSEEENKDFAFLYHGSMVPTQFYLWYEMMQRSEGEDKKSLGIYYPMFRRYYCFYAGRAEGSTTARLNSGLRTVYDYFYNASGMDDYPAQSALHRKHLEKEVAPVCSNVHLIRIARIMKKAAEFFGYPEDLSMYEDDIRTVTKALQKESWDEESGYYGYVLHDQEGMAAGIFRDENGNNYNRGIDGVTPLIAGICTEPQEEKLLGHLKSDRELWSLAGISTVDMSAPYYYDNGYWNGSVWFPYQYLIWKAMLDLGDGEFAFAIAQRALEAWSSEADFSYNTFEMIQIKTGRGGWFHQFGGLSAPVCVWYQAYYSPGTVNAGFDTWVERSRFDPAGTRAEITCRNDTDRESILIVSMKEQEKYSVTVNGRPGRWMEHISGTLELKLSPGENEILIDVCSCADAQHR